MVEEQLVRRGIHDAGVLHAMRVVPREDFVSSEYRLEAYDDCPLPIEEGQTISQPYIVALMAQLLMLSPHDRVLDIGTGSGYAAAVLSQIAAEVYTVERLELAQSSDKRLRRQNTTTSICWKTAQGWRKRSYTGSFFRRGAEDPGCLRPAAISGLVDPGQEPLFPGTHPVSGSMNKAIPPRGGERCVLCPWWAKGVGGTVEARRASWREIKRS
jgi:hypothetical protein